MNLGQGYDEGFYPCSSFSKKLVKKMSNTDYALQMIDINKAFNSVPVLSNASFFLKKGEVHALVGGNGAGKSTLMKILTGVYKKDSGKVIVNGKEVDYKDALGAEKHGIAMIFQEFSLIPTLTVAQNISLTREPQLKGHLIDDRKCKERALDVLNRLNIDIDPNEMVGSLSAGYCQMIEIAKAISKDANILVMDEPTSSLSESETISLFSMIKQLKEKGISIVYITHRMSEVFSICDRVTVLKDGETVSTSNCSDVTLNDVVTSMLGTKAELFYEAKETKARDRSNCGDFNLKVENLAFRNRLKDVSFEVSAGEIVGLAGLMGSGRTEIAQCIFGITKPDKGKVKANDKTIKNKYDSLNNGIALVPENRRTQGLVLSHSIRDNIALPILEDLKKGLFVDDKKADAVAESFIKRLNIKTDSAKKVVRLLSGGNQQKVVLAKWLAHNPKLLILDEPTVGVDIGAKNEIYEIIRELAQSGISIIMISSELEEILAVSDRILVLYDGIITRELENNGSITEGVLHNAIQGN